MNANVPQTPPPLGSRQIILILIAAFTLSVVMTNDGSRTSPRPEQLSYSAFLSTVESGEVRAARIQGQTIEATRADGRTIATFAPEGADAARRLIERGVDVTALPPARPSLLAVILANLLPIIVLIGAMVWLSRRATGGAGGGPFSFGKSKARMLEPETVRRVTFEDVAGIDEAKEDLVEIVEFLKDPQKFQRLGGRIPRGVLLVGPPGTGKTLTARAVAGEANVPFFTISGSDFVEMFVGVGASRVRDMFEQAKKNAPCIIFIDEIDAVGRHRGAGLGGGNDEREQTLNQLLVEMDGFEPNEGIIIIAATNRPDVLDPALLRPGRFDRQIVVPNPDVQGREKILRVHVRKVPLGPDVDLRVLARGTPGFSGADLMNLVNEAALLAARRNKRIVTMSEFEDAKDKVMMGAERRTLALTEEEKRLTAYHEAGHALVALDLPGADPVHKATIIPRGRALGMVVQLPERDKLSMSYRQMTARLAILMAGRAAEEIVFGKENVTSGAASDIEQATRLARMMVTRWGYSDDVGAVAHGDDQGEVFLGMSMGRPRQMSEATAERIDAEVRRLIAEASATAQEVLTRRRYDLEALAKGLIDYETLSGDEIRSLLAGRPPLRGDGEAPPPASTAGGAAGRPRGLPSPKGRPRPQLEGAAG